MSHPAFIVDDSSFCRFVTRRMLDDSGLFSPILELEDGLDLLALVDDPLRFDSLVGGRWVRSLVLLDQSLARSSGLETIAGLLERIHRGFDEDRLAIVACTASDDPVLHEQLLDSGLVRDCLPKPLRQHQLPDLARYCETLSYCHC
ncbi:MAG: response regulator [Acidobacteriota bacterium]